MFIYTENYLNLIETLKLTNYHTKHTTNIKMHVQKILKIKTTYFSKIGHSFESALSDHFYGQAGNYCVNCFRHYVRKTELPQYIVLPNGKTGTFGSGISFNPNLFREREVKKQRCVTLTMTPNKPKVCCTPLEPNCITRAVWDSAIFATMLVRIGAEITAMAIPECNAGPVAF